MDEIDLIDELISELRLAGESWAQRGYKDGLFRIFRQFPKDKNGVPLLWGEKIKEQIRSRLGSNSNEYEEIEDTVREFCSAWNEWKYALEHFGPRGGSDEGDRQVT